MSDEQLTGGQNLEASGTPDAGEAKKDLVAYDTYRKVLAEKKKRDQDLAAVQAELDALKSVELERSGKTQEAMEQYKKRLADAEAARTEERKRFAWHSVTAQVKSVAREMGCIDPDALMKLADFSGVEVGEDYSLASNDVKRLIEENRTKLSYLFKKNAPAVNDLPPSSGRPGAPKPVNERSADELLNMFKAGQFQK